ncbi:MAG TPA: GDSL-type esterase/lipase family protein, partial [Polyangiaceae bacterium]|nr:GDSL-type esterase/lipase family protein [Polyangiaceae bacterium]
ASSSSSSSSGGGNSGGVANPGGGGTAAGGSSGGAQSPPGGGQMTPPAGGSGSSSGGAGMPSGSSGGGGGAGADAGAGARDSSSPGVPNDASTVAPPPTRDGAASAADQSALPAITVHLAGDSTMSDYTAATTQEGWGQELGQYFISKVTIDNQAQPGANIDTFYAGRWKTLIGNVKAGDFVMAAFGINDSGTTHGPVAPAAFQTQMGVMADEVAAKNATFIPTTSSPLQVWVGTMETNTRLQPYCDATIALGMMKGLPVDDLNARGVAYYNMIGQTAAAALTFNGDKAHFDKQGATEIALLASQELARINSPLAAYLK